MASAAPSQQAFAINPDDDDVMQEDLEDERFQKEAINELERYRRIDEWISSYQNTYSVTALQCMQRLLKVGVIKNKHAEILQYTRPGNADEVRLKAFGCLVELNIAKRPQMLKYMLHMLCDDSSPFFRNQLLQVLGQALGTVALKDEEAEKPPPKPVGTDELVMERPPEEAQQMTDLAAKWSPELALVSLKAALVDQQVFKEALWHAIQSPILAISEVVSLLDIAALIYESFNGLVVNLRLPRYYSARNVGKGKVLFKEKQKYRTTPVNGIGLDMWPLVEQYDLKYNGSVSKAVKEYQRSQKQQARDQEHEKERLQSQIAAMKQQVQEKQQNVSISGSVRPPSVPMPSTAMSPPPLPVSTPGGPAKITLKTMKRKQSWSAEPHATSPKRPHLSQSTNGTTATPKVEKSPSISLSKTHKQTPSRAVSGTPAPSSATVPRKPAVSDKAQESRIVKLKFKRPKQVLKILSQPPRPDRAPKQKTNAPAKINIPSSASKPSSATGASNNADFFSSPSGNPAVSTGAFRTWGGMTSVKNEPGTDSAPPSAVSPMTAWPPGNNSNGTPGGAMSPALSQSGETEQKKKGFKLKLTKRPV